MANGMSWATMPYATTTRIYDPYYSRGGASLQACVLTLLFAAAVAGERRQHVRMVVASKGSDVELHFNDGTTARVTGT